MPKSSLSSASSQIAQSSKIRRKQIEKMKQNKLKVYEIHRDVQYRVDFHLRKENKMYSILIDLPPAFPSEAPMLFIYPPCSHKYLDAAQVVIDFPPLVNFKNKPDLANVVKKLISELEKNPPLELLYPGYELEAEYERRESQTTQTSLTDPTASSTTAAAEEAGISTNAITEEIPGLDEKSVEEMQEILSDEAVMTEMISETQYMKKYRQEKEEVLKSIEETANQNLTFSQKLNESREKLVEANDECRSLKEKWDKNMKVYLDASEWLSLNNLSLTMRVSAAEAEEKSEKIAEEFLEGKINVSEFAKEFVKTKATSNSRKAKEDKIHHFMLVTS